MSEKPDFETLKKHIDLILDNVNEKHHSELKKLPHVLNTWRGTKVTAGKDTGLPCIVVFVDKKVPRDKLKPEEIIPETVEGVPTDVVELKPVGWVAGKTRVSSLSPSEQKKLLGAKPKDKDKSGSTLAASEEMASATYEVDWEAAGKCTPVEDQDRCGSCTAFGCLDAFQDDLDVAQGIVVSLSKEQAFFCSGGTCNGGNTVENVLNFLVNTGVALTKDCPYVSGNGQDEPCGYGLAADWYLRGKKLLSWSYAQDAGSMKAALQKMPIVTTMEVYASFFNYISGVYTPVENDIDEGGHCIEVVGCSDSGSFWKAKNSWGTGWGMAGYFEIAYGTCSFDEEMYVLVPNGTPTSVSYVITASAGKGGSIDPSGEVQVAAGADITFKVTPKFCYKIADVTVDGASVGAVSSYTFPNVTVGHSIAASFTKRFAL